MRTPQFALAATDDRSPGETTVTSTTPTITTATNGTVLGPALSLDQARRYARHIIRPEVGSIGQRKQLADINPDVNVVTYNEPISSENALDIMRDFDIIVNGSDNFPTRYLVND